MKATFGLIAIICITGVFFIQGSRIQTDGDPLSFNIPEFVYPAEVRAVIDKKCYGCHSIKGKLDKAREALMWDSVPNFSKAKLVAKLGDIIDVLDEGSMPPEEVVKKYPEAKLLPQERRILKDWAEAKADSLLN